MDIRRIVANLLFFQGEGHHSTGEKTKRIAGVIFIPQKFEGGFCVYSCKQMMNGFEAGIYISFCC